MNTNLPPAKILGSWKEIAAYLGKGVRTVQRWERGYGLPVRRPVGVAQGVVYASPAELDAWLAQYWMQRSDATAHIVPAEVETGKTPSLVQISRELRQANRELMASLLQTVESVKQGCASLAQLVPQPDQVADVRRQAGGPANAQTNLDAPI